MYEKKNINSQMMVYLGSFNTACYVYSHNKQCLYAPVGLCLYVECYNVYLSKEKRHHKILCTYNSLNGII